MAGNQAAWIDRQHAKLRVGPADMPKAGADDVVIRNHAVAVNPLEWKASAFRLVDHVPGHLD